MFKSLSLPGLLVVLLLLFSSLDHLMASEKINKTPLFGSLKLEFSEQVVLNSLKVNEKHFFYTIHDMVVTANGEITILTDNSIMKLSEKGKINNTYKIIKGEGPGEFMQNPRHLFIDNNDYLYVPEPNKIVLLDGDFNFKRNIKIFIDKFLRIDKKGNLYTIMKKYKKSGFYSVLTKYDGSGTLLKEIKEYRDFNSQKIGNITLSRSHEYLPELCFELTSDDYLICILNLDYKFFKYDPQGNLNVTFYLDEKPEEITREEKEWFESKYRVQIRVNTGSKIKTGINFPSHRPFVKGILIDEKDRIYALRRKSVLDNDRKEIVDIFNKNGSFLYRTTFPFSPKIIKNGIIYAVERSTDENEEYIFLIKKYVIKNYQSLKY